RGDRLTERAGAAVEEVGHREGAGQAAVLEGFDPKPRARRAVAGPSGGRDRRTGPRGCKERAEHVGLSRDGVVCSRMTTALSARGPGAGWGRPRHDVVGPRAGGGLAWR